MITDYATRRGALLARMEHDCIRAGEWLVEGCQVYRDMGPGWWWVVGTDTDPEYPFRTFTDALDWVAVHIGL